MTKIRSTLESKPWTCLKRSSCCPPLLVAGWAKTQVQAVIVVQGMTLDQAQSAMQARYRDLLSGAV